MFYFVNIKYYMALKKIDAIYDRIRHLMGLKGGSTYVFFNNFGKIKIVSGDDLPLEETVTLNNVKITSTIIYFYETVRLN